MSIFYPYIQKASNQVPSCHFFWIFGQILGWERGNCKILTFCCLLVFVAKFSCRDFRTFPAKFLWAKKQWSPTFSIFGFSTRSMFEPQFRICFPMQCNPWTSELSKSIIDLPCIDALSPFPIKREALKRVLLGINDPYLRTHPPTKKTCQHMPIYNEYTWWKCAKLFAHHLTHHSQ